MKDLDALTLPELFAAIVPADGLRALVSTAREEDLGDGGDVTTSSIAGAGRGAGHRAADIVLRAKGVVAGLAAVPVVLDVFGGDVALTVSAKDGDRCAAGTTIGQLQGDLASILLIERTMLNLLGHLSGIASLTRRYMDAVDGCPAVICATRKTLPGLRGLQKYAVRCGGGLVHRLGLFDAALYKDNHLAGLDPGGWADALGEAIEVARATDELRFVQVEVDTLDQLDAVLALRPGMVDLVLLDNMDPATLRAAVAARADRAPSVGLEASGGITLETVRAAAETGVDRISVGALTHSAPGLDIGLDLRTS